VGGAWSTNAVAGTANRGGGGGGGSRILTANPIGNGANGGTGVVILKIPSSYTATFSVGITSSVDSFSVPGFKIYTCTAGTGTVTFS
jgi:hypothetical protein